MHRCTAGSTLSMQLDSAFKAMAWTHLPCSLPSCSCLACCMFGTAWEGYAMSSLDPTASPSRREPVGQKAGNHQQQRLANALSCRTAARNGRNTPDLSDTSGRASVAVHRGSRREQQNRAITI